MRNKKTIGMLLLLAVLTVAVVFVPQLISEGREGKRLNKITYRDYNPAERAKLADTEVARLYVTRQIDIDGNLRMVDHKGSDTEVIRTEVMELLDRLLGKGTDRSDPFNARIEESTLSCYRSSCLILVDNHPTALNFVNCCIKEEDFVFVITYEEKTKTLLSLAAEPLPMLFSNSAEAERYSTEVESTIKAFFEERLGLQTDEYYVSVDLSEAVAGAGPGYPANAVIRCGILQADGKGKD